MLRFIILRKHEGRLFAHARKFEIASSVRVRELFTLLGLQYTPNTTTEIDIHEARRRVIYARNTWQRRSTMVSCSVRRLEGDLLEFEHFVDEAFRTTEEGTSKIVWA